MVTFQSRATKWLALALFASLAANLFMAGIYAGRMFTGHGARHAMPAVAEADQPALPPFLGRVLDSVPAEHRGVVEAVFAERRPALQSASRTVREARQRVGAVLSAEKLDRPALEAAFAELRFRTTEMQAVLHGALATAAERLPPEARPGLVAAGGLRRGERRSGGPP